MEVKEKLAAHSAVAMALDKKGDMIHGLKAGIPIAIGYVPIAIAFGLLAKSSGIPNYISLMMSLVIFAGASQFVGVNLIALGTGFSEIILTTFILNLRHFLMSASLYQRIQETAEKGMLMVMSFGITDETFSVASLQKDRKLSVYFLLTLNLVAFSAWNMGTAIGIFLAEGLPDALKSSMGIALYAMFIGLLIPSMAKSMQVVVVSMAAAGVHAALHWIPLFAGLSTGWAIIISTMVGALAGSIFFAKEAGQHE